MAVFLCIPKMASCLASRFSNFFFVNNAIDVKSVAPATVQPIGPASASSVVPAAVPPPPAEIAPPPSQASAAFDATAPDSEEMAVPVDAVPKVVAIHIAAEGGDARNRHAGTHSGTGTGSRSSRGFQIFAGELLCVDEIRSVNLDLVEISGEGLRGVRNTVDEHFNESDQIGRPLALS
ncbi:hypothetical protein [Gordonia malaquae]|uniref:hypothetical protein n=1 Tax=Gordonia malaquae TaxID=410332 RepID=UPI003019E573